MRYRQDPAVRSLCATVVPMAGLLAETGLTLREEEATSLRAVASTPAPDLDLMLLSAEQFCDLHTSDLTVDIRRGLLDRLGMYGVRVAVQEIQAGATTAATLGPKLVARSGLDELHRVIAEHLLPRARVLQARSALLALRALAQRLRATDPARADYVDREAERIEAGVVDFARIRAAHLLASGGARVADGERPELERLFFGATAAEALGLPGGTPAAELTAASLSSISRWRERASDPLAEPALVEVCETAARTGEAIYASTQQREGGKGHGAVA
jgi:triphosphoribosyl-dephospho-CoA synthetase